ncbi:MAG TPA: cell division ATP-binding protein FtsE [Firmicutes bacterium]|nr:cell division ATP-binding protein FtsE [Bacillota bacterium]
MIETQNLTKKYVGGCIGIENLNLTINRGEFVFIVGPSGAGKSTFLKLIIREIAPTSGKLKVLGQDLSTIPRRRVPFLRRNIGMVFQDFRLLEDRTAYENVAFAMYVVGAHGKEVARRVPMVLELVGLLEKSKVKVGDLSGGEQQRVGIARAIVNRPGMIVADEPTGNLDPATSIEIVNLIRTINIRGTTVIIATHDREIVDYFKQRVIYLKKGQLVGDEQKGAYSYAL